MRAHPKHQRQHPAKPAAGDGGAAVAQALPAAGASAASVAPPSRPVLSQCPPPLDEPQLIKPLDDGWRQWLAENALLGNSQDSMLVLELLASMKPVTPRPRHAPASPQA